MTKTKDELMQMEPQEIAKLVRHLESDTQFADSLEFAEWCGTTLDAVLEAKGIDMEDWSRLLN